jgi:hypothetical protein
MMEHHLPWSPAAAATNQSKLPKDNGGQSPRKVVGHNGLDQTNENNGYFRVGGGTTWTASQSRKAIRIGGGGNRMMIKSDCNAMQQQ